MFTFTVLKIRRKGGFFVERQASLFGAFFKTHPDFDDELDKTYLDQSHDYW